MSIDTMNDSDYEVRRIDGKTIALEAEKYSQLFAWVRKYTHSDLCAWLIAQDLNRALTRDRNRGFEQQRSREVENNPFKNEHGKYVAPARIP